MGTKNNPGKYDCYDKAEDDEPMFVLLARDPAAPILVEAWAEFLELRATTERDMEKVEEARLCAINMRNWKSDHPDH